MWSDRINRRESLETGKHKLNMLPSQKAEAPKVRKCVSIFVPLAREAEMRDELFLREAARRGCEAGMHVL